MFPSAPNQGRKGSIVVVRTQEKGTELTLPTFLHFFLLFIPKDDLCISQSCLEVQASRGWLTPFQSPPTMSHFDPLFFLYVEVSV